VSHPERMASATAAISSSPTAGGWKPRNVSRLVDDSFDNGFEAYALDRARRTLESLLARRADHDHRTRPVCSAPELRETMPRTPVQPHVHHAVKRARVFGPVDRAKLAGLRDEKLDARAAGALPRKERAVRNVFAEDG
jgi:hypothetical protein